MKCIGRIRVVLFGLPLFAFGGSAIAQTRGTTIGAEAAYACDNNSSFSLTSAEGEVSDTVRVYMTANTNSRTAQALQITFTWKAVSQDLIYVGLDTTGFELSPSQADFDDSLYNDTLRVTITGNWTPQSFSGDTLFAVKFRLDCMPANSWRDVPIVGSCTDDRTFFQVADTGTFAGVVHNNGKARIKPLVAQMFFEGSKTTQPRDTAELVVDYTTNFDVQTGYVFNCTFDTTQLTYVGYKKTGYAAAGHTLTDERIKDTIRIRANSSATLPADTAVALFGVLFRNETTTDSAYFSVQHQKTRDTMYMCNEAYAVNSEGVGGVYVITPVFAATYDVADKSIVEGNSGVMDFLLTNSMRVDMTTSVDTCMAAYRLDASGFNWITVGTSGADRDWVEGVNEYYWEQLGGTASDRRVFREDINVLSDPILVHSVPTKVSGVGFTANSVDSTKVDSIFFSYATSTSDGSYKRDVVLKAQHLNLVIRPDTALGDNHITLGAWKVTVLNQVGGGGGSCPFVSVWNGRSFVEENTILTQSEYTADGIAVTDFYPLENQPQLGTDGYYRLLIEEREDEVSYLDNIRLLRVYADHPVSVTPDGEFFYEHDKLRPVEAVDYRGEDVLETVQGDDDDVYSSGEAGWLVVSYVPEYNAGGRVFAGHVVAAKDPCNQEKVVAPIGPLKDRMGPIQLAVSYRQSGSDWVHVDATPPRDQNTPTFSATDLQIRAGERIDVKYEWTRRWVADELPLVVASSEIPKPFELIPLAAFHSGYGQVAKTVKAADNEFVVLKKGESLELQFPAGGRPNQNSNAYFVVAAKGYYTPYGSSENTTLPTSFALHPNYPNPFNASTQVAFALPVESKVDIGIFNVLGQKVRTLVSGDMPAGEHLVTWDGANDQGTGVASGTYFVRMQAGEFTEKRKMTLLK